MDSDKYYTDLLEKQSKELIAKLSKERDAALAREAKMREALQEVAAHAPAELEPEDGARWVGMGTMMKVCAALSATSAQDLWLPIDSAPKDGSPILVNAGAEITTARWRPTPSQANGYWALCIYGDFATSDEVVPDPTRWQPLPPL